MFITHYVVIRFILLINQEISSMITYSDRKLFTGLAIAARMD